MGRTPRSMRRGGGSGSVVALALSWLGFHGMERSEKQSKDGSMVDVRCRCLLGRCADF